MGSLSHKAAINLLQLSNMVIDVSLKKIMDVIDKSDGELSLLVYLEFLQELYHSASLNWKIPISTRQFQSLITLPLERYII